MPENLPEKQIKNIERIVMLYDDAETEEKKAMCRKILSTQLALYRKQGYNTSDYEWYQTVLSE